MFIFSIFPRFFQGILILRFLVVRLRPRLDPLLDLGQLVDPAHERRELRRVLLPVVGDPVAQHVHRVRHTDNELLCTVVIGRLQGWGRYF